MSSESVSVALPEYLWGEKQRMTEGYRGMFQVHLFYSLEITCTGILDFTDLKRGGGH